jgi:hypothetical protein
MSSLAMQGIERDQVASETELAEQRLGGRDLVGLFVNVAVRQHQRGAGGKDAEHLRGGAVAELVEAAAQRLAIARLAALGLAQAVCNRPAWRRKTASRAPLSRPCRMLRIEVCAGARRHVRPKVRFKRRRCSSMKVATLRYELPPLTMARIENSSTCGNR